MQVANYLLHSLHNVINILVSTLRQLESRAHGDELAEEYSEPCQTWKIVLFAKIVVCKS